MLKFYIGTYTYLFNYPWHYNSEESGPTESVAARWQCMWSYGQQIIIPHPLISVFLTYFATYLIK